MSTRERAVAAEPEQVRDVPADGWLHPLLVVGASRMRGVDETWPGPGVWPLPVEDTTEVVRRDGPGPSTVVIHEDVVAGPVRLVPSLVREPPISWRHTETLRRLGLLVEGRASRPAAGA